MELLHTQEEIRDLHLLEALINDLKRLRSTRKDLQEVINTCTLELQVEVDKYGKYVGKRAMIRTGINDYRFGTIEPNFEFNSLVKSVTCIFRYDNQGFDRRALTKLLDIPS